MRVQKHGILARSGRYGVLAKTRLPLELQPHVEACVQRCGDDGDWAWRGRPLYRHYLRLLDGGTKPNLAKLTIARQIASIALSLWRKEREYNPKKLETTAV